jgi:hypothetical protein
MAIMLDGSSSIESRGLRMTAKAAIEDKIVRLNAKIKSLESLLDFLGKAPKLPLEVDEALWNFVVNPGIGAKLSDLEIGANPSNSKIVPDEPSPELSSILSLIETQNRLIAEAQKALSEQGNYDDGCYLNNLVVTLSLLLAELRYKS